MPPIRSLSKLGYPKFCFRNHIKLSICARPEKLQLLCYFGILINPAIRHRIFMPAPYGKPGFFCGLSEFQAIFLNRDLDKAKFRIYIFSKDETLLPENTPSTFVAFLFIFCTRWHRQVLPPAPSTLDDVEREYSGLQITCIEGCDSACDMSFTVY